MASVRKMDDGVFLLVCLLVAMLAAWPSMWVLMQFMELR